MLANGGYVYDTGQCAGLGSGELKQQQGVGAFGSQLPTGSFSVSTLDSSSQANGQPSMQVQCCRTC